MKALLREMFSRGIQSARFTARVSGRSPRGFLILKAIRCPVGDMGHLWIKPEHFRGDLPAVGQDIEFLGNIFCYRHKGQNDEDFSLKDIRVIQ